MTHDRLAAQQAAFAALLREPRSPDGDAAAAALATGNARLSPAAQIDIYREQYILRHTDVLREDFGSLVRLLGDDRFQELAHAYLAAHPPASFTLRDLGGRMPRFVTEIEPWRGDRLLADLAALEWAFVEAFDAAAAPRLDASTLRTIPEDAWSDVRIVFQPSLRRLTMAFPAHDYRLGVRDGATVTRPDPRATHVVVYRGPDVLHCLALDPDAYALLDALAGGARLGDACEAAALTSGVPVATFEVALGRWFEQWTSRGWISRVV